MKGMQKISRGGGFGGAARYALDRDGELHGDIIGGNMLGKTAAELEREFHFARVHRPDIEKCVWHSSMRLVEGEMIDDDKWRAIADEYMSRMGFTDMHPRVVMKHDDRKGQHIHIIASRVGLDGSVFYGKNENLESTRIIGELELKHGLQRTKQREDAREPGKMRPKKAELERAERLDEVPARVRLQGFVDDAKRDKPDIIEFIHRLDANKVGVAVNVASTGKMHGFSFEIDGVAFKGSQLGAAYTWKNLSKEVSYDPDHDYERLQFLNGDGGKSAADGVDGRRKGADLDPARAANAPASDAERDHIIDSSSVPDGGSGRDEKEGIDRTARADAGDAGAPTAPSIRDHARGVRHHESGGVRPQDSRPNRNIKRAYELPFDLSGALSPTARQAREKARGVEGEAREKARGVEGEAREVEENALDALASAALEYQMRAAAIRGGRAGQHLVDRDVDRIIVREERGEEMIAAGSPACAQFVLESGLSPDDARRAYIEALKDRGGNDLEQNQEIVPRR